jgi:PAS domain S-box-containing protein
MREHDDHRGGEAGASAGRVETGAVQALRESEARTRAILDAAVDAIITIDEDGSIESLNPAAERLFGYPAGELVGRNVKILMPEPYRAEHDGYLANYRATGQKKIIGIGREVVGRRKDGTTFPMHLAVSELQLGSRRMFTGIARDITELRKVEDALREANARKDAFLAMLAHELRNPLAPIRNALHVLRLRADLATIDRMREMMERQVGHLSRMVDDLLDVSRLTRGTVTLHRDRLDLTRIVRVCAEDRRRLFEHARIELLVDVPGTPTWISGDATRITQILDNLFSNALKFTPGGGSVWVELRQDATAGRAGLTVRDNGAGIPTDVLPHVFEAFAQADRSLDRPAGGLGLGLTTARGLVELHGGQIEASSAGAGKGSEFRVSLPLSNPAPEEDRAPVGPAAEARDRRRVLVVEDNADAADSVRLLLEMFGYEVTVTYSGQSGVEIARRVRPDAVVCDIGLPGMDGYAVAVALRETPETSGAHLIAVTGYGQENDRRRAIAAGFDEHLTKPVDPQALLDRLANPAR